MTDDIIRKFLDLHPDTPLNWDVQYAIHLRAIKRMLEVAAAAEREKCAKHFDGSDYMMYRSEVAAAIRERNP